MTRLLRGLAGRIVAVLLLSGCAVAVLAWLDLRPNAVGVLSVTAAVVFAHAAFGSADSPWPTPLWRRPAPPARTPGRDDGRLRFIRRTVETATRSSADDHLPRDAERLRDLLRSMTLGQLRMSRPNDSPEQRDAYLAERAPAVHTYLAAETAPPLDIRAINALADRIEDL